MRFGIVLLAAGLLVGCQVDTEINRDMETQTVLCYSAIAIAQVSKDADLSGTQKALIEARNDCRTVLVDKIEFQKLATEVLLEKFDSPDDVKLKDLIIRDQSRAAFQNELAGKISVKNDYGDFGEYRYFNLHVDNATFKWVVNFE